MSQEQVMGLTLALAFTGGALLAGSLWAWCSTMLRRWRTRRRLRRAGAILPLSERRLRRKVGKTLRDVGEWQYQVNKARWGR